MDLFHAFALLFLASAGLLVGLSLLVVSHKAMRDRRTWALWTVLRPQTGWGEMTRVGFEARAEPVPDAL